MKKIILILIASLCFSAAYASKFSRYMNKMDAQEKAQQQREWQQDMDFKDMVFRLQRRYMDDQGQRCRDYIFRARSNPYRHGHYVVCDER